MSNENNNNQQNIEQEQIKNKNWWKMLFGITQTYKVQIKLILIIFSLPFSFNYGKSPSIVTTIYSPSLVPSVDVTFSR